MIKKIWDKITIVITVPVGMALVMLAVFGQLCLDKLPYLVC